MAQLKSTPPIGMAIPYTTYSYPDKGSILYGEIGRSEPQVSAGFRRAVSAGFSVWAENAGIGVAHRRLANILGRRATPPGRSAPEGGGEGTGRKATLPLGGLLSGVERTYPDPGLISRRSQNPELSAPL